MLKEAMTKKRGHMLSVRHHGKRGRSVSLTISLSGGRRFLHSPFTHLSITCDDMSTRIHSLCIKVATKVVTFGNLSKIPPFIHLDLPWIMYKWLKQISEFIFLCLENMVSGPQLEYSIHPTLAILTLLVVWKMMDEMVDAIKRPKLANNW